jgi:hypothetical protein
MKKYIIPILMILMSLSTFAQVKFSGNSLKQ